MRGGWKRMQELCAFLFVSVAFLRFGRNERAAVVVPGKRGGRARALLVCCERRPCCVPGHQHSRSCCLFPFPFLNVLFNCGKRFPTPQYLKEHPGVRRVIHAYHRYSEFKTLAATCHTTEKLPPGTWTSALASVGLPAGITSLVFPPSFSQLLFCSAPTSRFFLVSP